jgi:hypothetical protein
MTTTSVERVDEAYSEACDISPQKMMGVALLGALGSLAIYYIYQSLSEDTREAIKENVTATLKSNLNKLTA